MIEKPALFTDGVQAGFSTRKGGASNGEYESLNLGYHVNDNPEHVTRNRHSLASAVGIPLEQWVFSEQTHRDQIVKVPHILKGSGARSQAGAIRDTDGLYTKENGIVLALLYADCIPIYFSAPEKHLIGIAHAGWKGTVLNIAGKMVKLWEDAEGVDRSEIQAVIGPGISKAQYEVDERIIKSVDETLNELAIEEVPYQKLDPDRFLLDLKKLNVLLLRNAGLHDSQIHVSPICVNREQEHFFSHRRTTGQTGRMAGWITQSN
ncbi:peptidoglycan editing factor PgeF [Salisediminibacterium beveridgei]|uniref:peptidoglycan editing factor PgeF n=1 Tax=Salisediminibacterium beveridgei TaxID=632773 RepID=UPI00084819AF|nr:peptidoglycan editing factor PgeF [Salisediminibacterium beveridgei]